MTETGPPVRRLDPEDAEALLPLVAALAAVHDEAMTAGAEDLRRDLRDGITWGVGAGTPLIGYALCSVRPKPHRGPRDASLDHIYVVPEHRRRGIARALVTSAEREALRRHCDRMVIGAHLGNDAARDAYLALGFGMNEPRYRRFTKRLGP